MATTVVLIAPQRPPRPADCMRRPPATAPPMPIAMSMTVPYPSPLRIFPPNQPATNPTTIHDNKYIQFSFTVSATYLYPRHVPRLSVVMGSLAALALPRALATWVADLGRPPQ